MDIDDNDRLEQARKVFSGPVAFLKSAPALQFLPDPDVAEVAFAGRSNVGKSSLLNKLTNRNGLARTSVTPGGATSDHAPRLFAIGCTASLIAYAIPALSVVTGSAC